MEDGIKPWIHVGPSVPAELIQRPLNAVCQTFSQRLKRDLAIQPKDREGFWGILWGLHESAVGCYAAVCILLDEKTRKTRLAAQAQVLNRVLVEAVANLVLLGEDPLLMSRVFERHSYRFQAMRLQRLKERDRGDDESVRAYFETYEQVLELQAQRLGLSAEETADPEGMIKERWPRLDGMVKGRMTKGGRPWVTESRLSLLEYFNKNWYGDLSDAAHQLGSGINAALLQRNPEHQWNPGYLESQTAVISMLLMTCALSEVESMTAFGAGSELRTVWESLRQVDAGEVDACFSLRYKQLLGDTKK